MMIHSEVIALVTVTDLDRMMGMCRWAAMKLLAWRSRDSCSATKIPEYLPTSAFAVPCSGVAGSVSDMGGIP
jgi:hypothetical protein